MWHIEYPTNHEDLIGTLEATGDYRVLRRLRPRARYHEPDGSDTKWAEGSPFDFKDHLKAHHSTIRQSNDALIPATPQRVFTEAD